MAGVHLLPVMSEADFKAYCQGFGVAGKAADNLYAALDKEDGNPGDGIVSIVDIDIDDFSEITDQPRFIVQSWFWSQDPDENVAKLKKDLFRYRSNLWLLAVDARQANEVGDHWAMGANEVLYKIDGLPQEQLDEIIAADETEKERMRIRGWLVSMGMSMAEAKWLICDQPVYTTIIFDGRKRLKPPQILVNHDIDTYPVYKFDTSVIIGGTYLYEDIELMAISYGRDKGLFETIVGLTSATAELLTAAAGIYKYAAGGLSVNARLIKVPDLAAQKPVRLGEPAGASSGKLGLQGVPGGSFAPPPVSGPPGTEEARGRLEDLASAGPPSVRRPPVVEFPRAPVPGSVPMFERPPEKVVVVRPPPSSTTPSTVLAGADTPAAGALPPPSPRVIPVEPAPQSPTGRPLPPPPVAPTPLPPDVCQKPVAEVWRSPGRRTPSSGVTPSPGQTPPMEEIPLEEVLGEEAKPEPEPEPKPGQGPKPEPAVKPRGVSTGPNDVFGFVGADGRTVDYLPNTVPNWAGTFYEKKPPRDPWRELHFLLATGRPSSITPDPAVDLFPGVKPPPQIEFVRALRSSCNPSLDYPNALELSIINLIRAIRFHNTTHPNEQLGRPGELESILKYYGRDSQGHPLIEGTKVSPNLDELDRNLDEIQRRQEARDRELDGALEKPSKSPRMPLCIFRFDAERIGWYCDPSDWTEEEREKFEMKK